MWIAQKHEGSQFTVFRLHIQTSQKGCTENESNVVHFCIFYFVRLTSCLAENENQNHFAMVRI